MNSTLLMTLEVAVGPPQKIGAVPHGTRVTAPITSGHFEGPRLRGRVLPGGGDWTLLRPDDASSYYFRTTPRFETGHAKYAFFNRLLAVATGDRKAAGPIYTIDEIL
jgi:hypothetical protein